MEALANLVYLAAAACFIVGLKRLSSPATARFGNTLASFGMLIAIVATLAFNQILTWDVIIAGMIIGSLIGVLFARKVQMTAMPQMVALLNGFGGGASALVASAEFIRFLSSGAEVPVNVGVSIQLSVLVGGLTFSGSLVAFAKLQELVTGRAVTYPLQKTLNAALLLGTVALVTALLIAPHQPTLFYVLVGISLLLGVLSVIPIGGADMPVVISLLNSYSGIAAAMTGFVINNEGLIISGALVGASGLILTNIMCKAMNRSLANVLFGAFGTGVSAAAEAEGVAGDRVARSVSHEDAAMMLGYAERVVIAPGYGLAVAQAQHEVRVLADLLAKRGVDVKYAIHPVAGRMPGHMNVLLAEANVPYDQLYDMDQINPEFDRTDVAVIIGANDVVNPDARKIDGRAGRHADSGCRSVEARRGAEAKHAAGIRGCGKPSLLRSQDVHAVRRCQGIGQEAGRRSEEARVGWSIARVGRVWLGAPVISCLRVGDQSPFGPRTTRTRCVAPSSARGISRSVSRQRFAVELQARDAAADPVRILDRDLVARRAVAEDDLEAPPGPRHAGIEDQRRAAQAEAEDPLEARPIHPSGRAGVPGPAAAPDVRRLGVDVGGRRRTAPPCSDERRRACSA